MVRDRKARNGDNRTKQRETGIFPAIHTRQQKLLALCCDGDRIFSFLACIRICGFTQWYEEKAAAGVGKIMATRPHTCWGRRAWCGAGKGLRQVAASGALPRPRARRAKRSQDRRATQCQGGRGCAGSDHEGSRRSEPLRRQRSGKIPREVSATRHPREWGAQGAAGHRKRNDSSSVDQQSGPTRKARASLSLKKDMSLGAAPRAP